MGAFVSVNTRKWKNNRLLYLIVDRYRVEVTEYNNYYCYVIMNEW